MSAVYDKYVCEECIGDPYVQNTIKEHDEEHDCSYCGKNRLCISLGNLADLVDPIYRENYQPGEEYPVLGPEEDTHNWETTGDDPEFIIAKMLQSDNNDVASDLVKFLSEEESFGVIRDGATAYYDSCSNYEKIFIDDREHSTLWLDFCEMVRHQSRFFNKKAIMLLDDLFSEINKLKYARNEKPIRIFGEKEDERFIFRARRANTANERIRFCLYPARELGPPPKGLARPGRMNPAGIPVFYGALDRDTCLSEIRLAVGEVALSCKFEIVKPLRVLDLTIFNEIYGELNMFDPNYIRKASRINFLRKFESMINKPVLPDDEVLEYIPTQAFIEYLENYYKPRIDAVIYSSTQTGSQGKNIVISSHAAKLGSIEKANHYKTNHNDYEEMWGDRYSIWKRQHQKVDTPAISFHTKPQNAEKNEEEKIEAWLKPLPDCLEIHRIQAVQYDRISSIVYISPSDEQNNMEI